MSKEFSWLDRPGSLSVNNKQILSLKIKELSRHISELKERKQALSDQATRCEDSYKHLNELRQAHKLTAKHILEINSLTQKIIHINKSLKEIELLESIDTQTISSYLDKSDSIKEDTLDLKK